MVKTAIKYPFLHHILLYLFIKIGILNTYKACTLLLKTFIKAYHTISSLLQNQWNIHFFEQKLLHLFESFTKKIQLKCYIWLEILLRSYVQLVFSCFVCIFNIKLNTTKLQNILCFFLNNVKSNKDFEEQFLSFLLKILSVLRKAAKYVGNGRTDSFHKVVWKQISSNYTNN